VDTVDPGCPQLTPSSSYGIDVAKKRQTFGKIQRERERAEKRERKQEKKLAKKTAAVAEAETPGVEAEAQADEPVADDELASTP